LASKNTAMAIQQRIVRRQLTLSYFEFNFIGFSVKEEMHGGPKLATWIPTFLRGIFQLEHLKH
jgi:hypothetical protein